MPLRTRCGTSRSRVCLLACVRSFHADVLVLCSVLPSESLFYFRGSISSPHVSLSTRLCSREQQRMTRFATPSLGRTCPRETYRFVPAHFAVGTATGGPPPSSTSYVRRAVAGSPAVSLFAHPWSKKMDASGECAVSAPARFRRGPNVGASLGCFRGFSLRARLGLSIFTPCRRCVRDLICRNGFPLVSPLGST